MFSRQSVPQKSDFWGNILIHALSPGDSLEQDNFIRSTDTYTVLIQFRNKKETESYFKFKRYRSMTSHLPI